MRDVFEKACRAFANRGFKHRCFKLGAVAAVLFAIASPAPAQDAGEIEFWKSVQNSNNPAELRAYLETYPQGRFVPLARLRISQLTGGAGAITAQPLPAPAGGEAASVADAERQLAAARAEIKLVRQQMDALRQALDDAARQGREKDAQISELGQRLNTALAAKVEARASGGGSARPLTLGAAIRAGDMEAVKAALAGGADVNALGADGMPPIGLAALYGKPAIIAYLAASGADLNRNDRYGFTPLMDAAIRGQPEAARMLIALGADPLAKGRNGNDPLGVARPYGNADPHQEGKRAVIGVLQSAIAARSRLGVPPERASLGPERRITAPAPSEQR